MSDAMQQSADAADKLWAEDEDELYDDDEEAAMATDSAAGGGATNDSEKTYLPGDSMPEDTELTFDPSAYVTHNQFTTEWPCLSCAVLQDGLGDNRAAFPMTAYMVAGTQAEEADKNQINVMKLSNITKTKEDSMESDSEDEDEDDTPVQFRCQSVQHPGGVNHIAMCPHESSLAATWADTGQVHMWDLAPQVAALDKPGKSTNVPGRAAYTFGGHAEEGYAMAWSPVVPYRFATGDNAANIHVWNRRDDGSFHVNETACKGHADSVEALAWSPTERAVFTSCSSDGSIKVWDVRTASRCAISINAHDVDINALSWNRCEQHLLVSGADDGRFRIWDLRTFGGAAKGAPIEPVADFKWHMGPVTSVEWHPTDASVLCVSGEDDQISIWDLAVEEDAEAQQAQQAGGDKKVPPQLLFIHQGQRNVKEAHWHPQLPGVIVSTSESGFNLFKTISVMS